MTRMTVNGEAIHYKLDPGTPLLYALRNDLGLNGPKFGCGMAQCGAGTVHIDGVAVRSCITPVSAAVGKQVTTIKGLGTADKPHPVQIWVADVQYPEANAGARNVAAEMRARVPSEDTG